jgi:hypothetical protein
MSTIALLSLPRVVRLVLERGEVCRLSRRASRVGVRSGTAWVAAQGRDYLLSAGQSLSLPAANDALLSGLGELPLMVELDS